MSVCVSGSQPMQGSRGSSDSGIWSRPVARLLGGRLKRRFTKLESGIAPGLAPRNHRTDSIDYGVIVSGEIDTELDGTSVHLKAGDVFVQRGTIHNWINRGTAPCVIAIVLIAAKSVEAGGKTLEAQG
jgi:quercetin dioxygenase-like cupin family protein